jgi:hypothetical protein
MICFVATPHAAERFVERVRPGLSAGAGKVELERLLNAFGEPVEDWRALTEMSKATCAFWIAPEIFVPCCERGDRMMALTVLVVGSLDPETRERRNAKRKRRTKENRMTDYERASFSRGKDWAA